MTFEDFEQLGLASRNDLPGTLSLALTKTSLLPVELVVWVATAKDSDLYVRLQQAVTTCFESEHEPEAKQAEQLAQLIIRRLGQLGTPVALGPQQMGCELDLVKPLDSVQLAAGVLRQPQLFDGLSAPSALCRDLIIWAAMCNESVVRLYVPEFCKTFGYDKANLLRRCTAQELQEISLTGWPKEKTQPLTNVLALALVRLITHAKLEGEQLVETIERFEVKKTGTLVAFTISRKLLEENRKSAQTILLSEYLSLCTQGGDKRSNGYADQAARKLYLRLSWHRQQWDQLAASRELNALDVSQDNYQELTAVAGLASRTYAPARKNAYQLRQLLERVGRVPSIAMQPTIVRNRSLNEYQISWIRLVV